jgi:SAM-dependent methyltransferase
MSATATVTAPHQPEWFASWFDSEHYHRLYANRDQHEAAAFVDRLIERLDPAPAATMLDLGCGSGRHSRSLAGLGFDVTGIDLSAASLTLARQQAGPPVRFIEQDMRSPFGAGVFDYVFSLFTSFGYFEDPRDHVTVIRNIARSLTAGGTLVLDYLNVHHAGRNLIAGEAVSRGEARYLITRWSDSQAFFKRIVVEDPALDAPLEHVERVAKFALADFRQLLARAGFTIDCVFGDYELGRFDPARSPRVIIVARKTTARVDGLPSRQVFADAAQRLGRHAEVRRQHRLRDALDDRRVGLEKLEIPLLGVRAQRADDPLILGGVVALEAGAEGDAVAVHRLDDTVVGRRVDQQQLGILDGVDKVLRRSAFHQAARVGQPPGLGRELDDVLLALRIDHEVAEAAAGHKSGVARDFAAPLQKFPGRQRLESEGATDGFELGIGEGCPRVQVGA